MSTDPIHDHLQALPAPPLPPDLWPRLAQRRQRQLVHRRAGTALAIGLLAFAPLVLVWQAQEASPAQRAAGLVAAPAIEARPAAAGDLSAIDRALQNAYARGATDAEIAPLWEARRRVSGQSRPVSTSNPS